MSKSRNMSDLLDSNGDVKAGALDNVPDEVVKSSSAPSSPSDGDIWYDTSTRVVKFYDGNATKWKKISAELSVVSDISGTIFLGTATTLTITGTGFLSGSCTVNFTQASDGINEDVVVTASSNTSITVAVPSAVYNNVTAGNNVSITVKNPDDNTSGAVNKLGVNLPSGGTVDTTSVSGYRIHTFTSSGTFTVPTGVTLQDVEYLVIAGGGGGGYRYGGGGAGGYRCSVTGEATGGSNAAESKLILSAGTYTVTVGAGGAGQSSHQNNNVGYPGGNSVFGSITSTGGGGGASDRSSVSPDMNGGSGGGGSGDGASTGAWGGGSGTSGQGTNGGAGWAAPGANGGGGGGGAQTGGGGAGSANGAGAGGSGLNSSITGTTITRAGGGGGSGQSGNTAQGGTGGGGNAPSQNGDTNKGAGGGSGKDSFSGAGGSGIVIVRYQLPT